MIVPRRRWVIQSRAPAFRADFFIECLERFAYISDEVTRLGRKCASGRADLYSLKQCARNMSGYIRMVLLGDSHGYFFSTCVRDPRIHPFRSPASRSLRPDRIHHETPEMAITYTVEGEDAERTLTTPRHEHTTLVGPLYGLEKVGPSRYRMATLLDGSKPPIKRAHWLDTKVFQIGRTVLTSGQILRAMANQEGVHIDEPMGRVIALTDCQPNKTDKTSAYLKGNLLLFGGLSYLHVFTILVGVYLTNMMRATVRHFPTELQLPRAVEAAKHIRSAPMEIQSPTMLLQQTPWLIMDEQEDAAESGAPLRAIPKPEKTIVRIP